MTRNRQVFLLCLSTCVLSAAAAADLPSVAKAQTEEIDGFIHSIESLIAATEELVQTQRHVLQLLIEYREVKTTSLHDPQNKANLLRMVKLAHALLTAIRFIHLSDAFDSDFLSELAFFSQIASKKNLPKP